MSVDASAVCTKCSPSGSMEIWGTAWRSNNDIATVWHNEFACFQLKWNPHQYNTNIYKQPIYNLIIQCYSILWHAILYKTPHKTPDMAWHDTSFGNGKHEKRNSCWPGFKVLECLRDLRAGRRQIELSDSSCWWTLDLGADKHHNMTCGRLLFWDFLSESTKLTNYLRKW